MTMHEKLIKAGCDWLDHHAPKGWPDGEHPCWEDRVDLVKLDFGSDANCLLGQLFGSFHEAARDRAGCWCLALVWSWGLRHGFCAPCKMLAEDDTRFRLAWVKTIAARRAVRAHVPPQEVGRIATLALTAKPIIVQSVDERCTTWSEGCCRED
jgi:hypothetical protein